MRKVLWIFSHPFGGSTHLAEQLGRIKNICAVGEIYDRAFRTPEQFFCLDCQRAERECTLFTPERVAESLTRRDDFYGYWLSCVSDEHMCVTDKHIQLFPDRIELNVEGGLIVPVLLYRNPLAYVFSIKNRTDQECSWAFRKDPVSVSHIVQRDWIGWRYREFERKLGNADIIHIDYDFFLAHPRQALEYICRAAGIAYEPADEPAPHFVGGNDCARVQSSADGFQFSLFHRNKPLASLPARSQQWYATKPEVHNDFRWAFGFREDEIRHVLAGDYCKLYAAYTVRFTDRYVALMESEGRPEL